ncbi:DUF4367 domain-containing protein [Sutcliffiella horikoshii]|uniref:DUF4367 domain-containing protein n=1 Tax=Sutcliffiella horikoshii TaxID=79883 RepID=UPI001F3BD0EA|nr:DUF4367 domain-containing protein [Sutcliffiella horikoshii]MCG1022891.1 DUF4367 domain-containing protein [Sutcliffiella horikoshii]
MFKKRMISFALLLTFMVGLFIGWWVWNGKLYEYDQQPFYMAAENLPFEKKIPTKVPFEEMEVSQRNLDADKESLTVTLSNINKEYIDVYIGAKETEGLESMKQQKVQIGGRNGAFISDEEGKRILAWQENDIHYQITYYYKLTPKEVSKKQLIQMAEAFTWELDS